jgi:hypothetical protein
MQTALMRSPPFVLRDSALLLLSTPTQPYIQTHSSLTRMTRMAALLRGDVRQEEHVLQEQALVV